MAVGDGNPMSKIMATLKDPKKLKQVLMNNKIGVYLWSTFFLLLFFVYHLLSDGDFSFFLTLGSMLNMFGFVVLVIKIVTQKSAKGISLKTLQIYGAVFFFRLCSILFYEGYLPFDSSGDWFYQFIEFTSMGIVGAAAFLVAVQFKTTYDPKVDYFGNMMVPPEFGAVWAAGPALLLALIFHPTLNKNFFTDTAWTFALFMEAVAILPQLLVFQRCKTEIEEYTSHFVSSLFFARLLQLIFWLASYHELADKLNLLPGGAHVGHFVILSQIVQLILMIDYIYYYLKALASGEKLTLPHHNMSTNV